VEDSYHRDRIANRQLHPETLMMGYGYAPGLSEGSLKPPIFLTSTFVFENAQQGKDFFDLTSGRRQPRPGEKSGLVYSRFNNPNLEILEDRLAIWDQAERSAVFASGMAAISTTLFAFLRAGDTILHSRPLYGGTETLLQKQMGAFGVTAFGFADGINTAELRNTAEAARAKGRVGGSGANCLDTAWSLANRSNDRADESRRKWTDFSRGGTLTKRSSCSACAGICDTSSAFEISQR
jgi:methionine-gamma-lyase